VFDPQASKPRNSMGANERLTFSVYVNKVEIVVLSRRYHLVPTNEDPCVIER